MAQDRKHQPARPTEAIVTAIWYQCMVAELQERASQNRWNVSDISEFLGKEFRRLTPLVTTRPWREIQTVTINSDFTSSKPLTRIPSVPSTKILDAWRRGVARPKSHLPILLELAPRSSPLLQVGLCRDPASRFLCAIDAACARKLPRGTPKFDVSTHEYGLVQQKERWALDVRREAWRACSTGGSFGAALSTVKPGHVRESLFNDEDNGYDEIAWAELIGSEAKTSDVLSFAPGAENASLLLLLKLTHCGLDQSSSRFIGMALDLIACAIASRVLGDSAHLEAVARYDKRTVARSQLLDWCIIAIFLLQPHNINDSAITKQFLQARLCTSSKQAREWIDTLRTCFAVARRHLDGFGVTDDIFVTLLRAPHSGTSVGDQ